MNAKIKGALIAETGLAKSEAKATGDKKDGDEEEKEWVDGVGEEGMVDVGDGGDGVEQVGHGKGTTQTTG